MQHLFDSWQEVSRGLAHAWHIVLLSDFDGTLAPIVEHAERASLPPGVKSLLAALAASPRYTIGFISGRTLSDLKARVGMCGVVYAGNHGLEIEGPDQAFLHPIAGEALPLFGVLEKVLSKGLAAVGGAFVENKGLTISVHYRSVAPSEQEEVRRIFERVMSIPRMLGRVKVTIGKKVHEVRPHVDWDKGRAVSHILAHHLNLRRKGDVKTIYLGDDVTDEDAFQMVNRMGGLSVCVGDDSLTSTAGYRLESVGQVREFLKRLVIIERGAHAWPV